MFKRLVMLGALGALGACGDDAASEDPVAWPLEEPTAAELAPPPHIPPSGPLVAYATRGPLGLWALGAGVGFVAVAETYAPFELRAELAGELEAPPSSVRLVSSAWPLQAAPSWRMIGRRVLIVQLPDVGAAPSALTWIKLEVDR